MMITTNIDMELTRRKEPAVVFAVQGDTNTRAIVFSLLSGGSAMRLASDTTARVRYRCGDGSGGVYDTLPDGSPACTVSGSTVSVILAPQLLAVAGTTELQISLTGSEEVFSTFSVYVVVHPDPSAEAVERGDYSDLTQWLKNAIAAIVESGVIDGVEISEIPSYIQTAADAVAEKIIAATGEAVTVVGTTAVNVLSSAIDTDGSVYGTGGYLTGYRLNSSGVAKVITEAYYDADVGVTGFIPCRSGDKLYFSGLVIDPYDTQNTAYNIHVYNASFETIGYLGWGTLPTEAEITQDGNGYVTSLTLAEGTILGNSETAYIRISARDLGAASVINLNETGSATAYTNVLTTVGYQTGYRINSSGSAVEITESYYDASVCATGYIPCQCGDVLRFRDLVIDPNDTQYASYNLHVYDSGYTSVGFLAWGNLPREATVTLDENGYVTMLTLTEGTILGAADTAYIRISAKNITSASIITVNEEIVSDEDLVTEDCSIVPFNLAFLTDLHWNDADQRRCRAAKHALTAIAQTAPLDLVCFGGDYIFNWSEETAENARADITACRRVFSDLTVPSIWLRGNHENNGYIGQRLDRAEIFTRTSRAQQTLPGFVSNPEDPYGCYGYLDFENARVRIIAVNTGDNDAMGPTVTLAGNAADLISCHNIAVPQLRWIADQALDLSDKDAPTEWTILVLSHIPIYNTNDWYNSHSYTDMDGKTWTCNVQNLETVMAAYRDGGSVSISLNGETMEKDFADVTPAGGILFINGHGHALNASAHNGFHYITCPNLCSNGEKVSSDGVIYAKGLAGTVEETAFNVLTIDTANRVVHAWIYGAGFDRDIQY